MRKDLEIILKLDACVSRCENDFCVIRTPSSNPLRADTRAGSFYPCIGHVLWNADAIAISQARKKHTRERPNRRRYFGSASLKQCVVNLRKPKPQLNRQAAKYLT